LFEADVSSAAFRNGVEKGLWCLAEPEVMPDGALWPMVYLWMKAAPRNGAPDRYYVALNAESYRASPPTGTFWDTANKTILAFAKRPKGRADSRVARVFRTDWEGGKAFYHPYDGHAARTHPDWKTNLPQLRWTEDHTIVDWIVEFQTLLMSPDYVGL
jgi:hypothetical protein